MKTSNKILLVGATVLVASILVNIGIDLHAYRTDSAWMLQLDSLLQRRTIRVLVEEKPFEGYCYHQFKTREEQEKESRITTTLTLFFPGTTPPTPETVHIQGDTLFLGAPILAGTLPNVELFIDSDGEKRNVLGLKLVHNDIPQFKEMKIER